MLQVSIVRMSPSKTKSCHFRKPPAAKAGMNLVWLNVSQIYTIDENSTRTACSLSSQYIPSLFIDPSHGVYVIQPFFFRRRYSNDSVYKSRSKWCTRFSEIIFYRNKDNKLNRPTIDKTQRVSLFRTQTAYDPLPKSVDLYVFLPAFGVKEKIELRPFNLPFNTFT